MIDKNLDKALTSELGVSPVEIVQMNQSKKMQSTVKNLLQK